MRLTYALLAAWLYMGVVAMEARAQDAPHKTDWFRDAGYGVFVHYLEGLQNNPDTVNSLGQRTSWDECVREFDTEAFADQMRQAGAGYVVFTVMQISRHLIAPNATYDAITGYQPGEACSTRDLIEDLYQSLSRRGIPLMLYWTGDGPRADAQAAPAMKCPPDGQVTEEFVRNWASVVREYGERYGDKVRGWWTDGCYPFIGYDDAKLGILAEALRAGYPDRLVALNVGVEGKVGAYSRHEDYTTGEQNDFHDVPLTRFLEGEQWHILSYLGDWWGGAGTRLGKQQLADYVAAVNAIGGVVSIDVLLYRDGTIDRSQLEVLKPLRTKLAQRAEEAGAWRVGKAVPPTNRAWRKPAALLSLDGSHALVPSVGDVHEARQGVDGDPNTTAQGGGEWPWTYQVDLQEVGPLSRVVVTFGSMYATEFEVCLSSDRESWETVGAFRDHDGARVELAFAPREARFVRVRGVRPDGPDQPGGQMAIGELEAYE